MSILMTMGRNGIKNHPRLFVLLVFAALYVVALRTVIPVAPSNLSRHQGLRHLSSNSGASDVDSWFLGVDGENVDPRLSCDSCALVGTLGTLVDSDAGSQIDSHSCVFRLGFSPAKGFENDVGTKTTARVVDSNRFYPFVKRPEKLIAGTYAADNWFIFDKRPGDITRFGEQLSVLTRKQQNHANFFWFSKKAEQESTQLLQGHGAALGYTIVGARPSSLWFAAQLLTEAKCRNITIYGVPDPKLCKRHLNVYTPCLYWMYRSPTMCSEGQDAGAIKETNNLSQECPSLAERRALAGWSSHKPLLRFRHPEWPPT